jgi:hypothetical protein
MKQAHVIAETLNSHPSRFGLPWRSSLSRRLLFLQNKTEKFYSKLCRSF